MSFNLRYDTKTNENRRFSCNNFSSILRNLGTRDPVIQAFNVIEPHS